MNRHFQLILGIAIVAMVASCKKTIELEVANPNQLTEANFWKSATDARQGVNAIYRNFARNGAPYSRWLPFYMDVRSDDGYSTSGWPELRSIGALNITQYSFEVNIDTWAHHWIGVNYANQVLQNVPAIEMDATLKNQFIGEAKFLRALYYYDLVTIWGNVPLVLTPSSPSDRPAQSTPQQVWTQIEQDLTDAAAALPASYPQDELGRATKGAAYGLLGRAYLQQGKNQQAVDALGWLVTGPGSTQYNLVANYADNFRHTTEFNAESVFEIQFHDRPENGAAEGPTSNVGSSRAPFFAPGGHGFRDANMHRWVPVEFQQERTVNNTRDPRLAVTVLYDSTDERGPDYTLVYDSDTSGSWTRHGYDADYAARAWYRKYLDDYYRIKQFEVFNSPINFRVIRYADVLLMYAEALNNLGRTADAYQYVDRVRQRAGLARLATIRPGMNQAQFLRQIMHERVTELTGESLRWNDLARWGYFDDAAKLAELKARDPEFNNFQIGRNKYMPIPQSELDINVNLKQNSNW